MISKTALIQAAQTLMDQQDYDTITLPQIAQQAQCTSLELNQQFTSKAALSIAVMLTDFEAWVAALETQLPRHPMDFAQQWSATICHYPRFLRLLGRVNTVLAPALDSADLLAYRKQYVALSPRLFAVIRRGYPEWSDRRCAKFIQMQTRYAVGLYPSTNLKPAQRAALEQIQGAFQMPDFRRDFTEFIAYTCVYLDQMDLND